MPNIVDYVKTEMRPFPPSSDEESEGTRRLSDIDSLVLSQLAYVHMPESIPRLPAQGALRDADYVPFRELLCAEHFDEMFPTKGAYSSLCALILAMAASPRFRDIRLGNYVSVEDDKPGHEKQFAAVCAILPDGAEFVGYRGSEDSLAAWKENFNMAFACPVPAQTSAAEYLRRVAAATDRDFVVGGHSKGGNLAVYASMKAPDDVDRRILGIYSHDGPGFEQKVLDSLDFERIRSRVHKTVPEASMIGMIFESQEDFTVVESSGHGITEHFAMMWSVRDGDFVRVPSLPQGTRYFNHTLNSWVASFTPKQRERVLTSLFDVLEATGYSTFSDMAVHWREALPAIREAMRTVDPADRKLIVTTFKVLFSTALRTARADRLEQPQRDDGHRRRVALDRDDARGREAEKRRIDADMHALKDEYKHVRHDARAEARRAKEQYKQAKRDIKNGLY